MLATQVDLKPSWNNLQETIYTIQFPNAYLRLLAALEDNWCILSTELFPSWDQNGFVYNVKIQKKESDKVEEIILPKSVVVDQLIEEYYYSTCF